MSDRSTWTASTHDWREDLDAEHLAQMRERLGTGDAAGGRRHLRRAALPSPTVCHVEGSRRWPR